MDSVNQSKIISTILKHENKRNTYKIALIRAINDVALEYPHLQQTASGVAIPLALLSEFWFAYYWTFVDPNNPIRQGHDSTDFAFRSELTTFRKKWQQVFSDSHPADGYFIKNQMSIDRKRQMYDKDIHKLYKKSLSKIGQSLRQPIKFAGKGQHSIFKKPMRLKDLYDVVAIPCADLNDYCIVVEMDLWRTFIDLSLWIEALCIHEWCLFSETVKQLDQPVQRGVIYNLLTARPDNRRPLTWERNQIELLLMEGVEFRCPWTKKSIRMNTEYDLDHIVPIAIRPINELWNLVPSDPYFNSHRKRDRLPTEQTMLEAKPIIAETYRSYCNSEVLQPILANDASLRFGSFASSQFEVALADQTSIFVLSIAQLRNIEQF